MCACARSVPSLTSRVTTLVPGYWWAECWVFFILNYSDYYGSGFWVLVLLLTKDVFVWLARSPVCRWQTGALSTPPPPLPLFPPLYPPCTFSNSCELQSLLWQALVNNGKCVRGRALSSLRTTPQAPEPSPGSPKEALRIMSFWRLLCCLSDPSLCLFVYYGLSGFLCFGGVFFGTFNIALLK